MKKKKPTKRIPPPPGVGAPWKEQSAYFDKYDTVDLIKAGYLQSLSSTDKHLFAELKTSARAHLKKSQREQLNLSLRTEELKRLHTAADRNHLQAATLARAWLLERLDHEVPRASSQ